MLHNVAQHAMSNIEPAVEEAIPLGITAGGDGIRNISGSFLQDLNQTML